MKGYRTLLLVALTELFSLWQATAPADVIPARWIPFATGAIGIGFGVLRFLTTGPVGAVRPTPAEIIGEPNTEPTPHEAPPAA